MKKLVAAVTSFILLVTVNYVYARETPEEPTNADIELSATELPDTLAIQEKEVNLGEDAVVLVHFPVAIKRAYVSNGRRRVLSIAMPWAPVLAVAYAWRVPQADGEYKIFAAFSKDNIVDVTESGTPFYLELLEARDGRVTSVRVNIQKNGVTVESKVFTKP